VLRGVQGGGAIWLSAAALILVVVPYTLVVVRPTNERLLQPGRDLRSDETRRLLQAWGQLHAIRTVLSMIASLLLLWAAAR
jgi:hypothetical protein